MARRQDRFAGVAVALALTLAGCAGTHELKAFTSDGCSLFPDRAPAGGADWCECCLAHDRAYWRGGTEAERAAADDALRACVLRTTGDARLADAMHAGVRAGGTPALPTWFRWGYGWQYDRGYAPLTPAERRLAERRAREGEQGKQCGK